VRILVDITHPAHALFFRGVIPLLERSGHQVRVTARDKDVTLPLLSAFGIEHQCLTTAGSSKIGRITELGVRNWRLLRVVRQFRPDVILAKHGLFACQVGWLAGVPAISFDDTDDAPIQQRLYFPFAWRIYTDRSYRTHIGKKHRRYNAVSPLAYLHPDVFTPQLEVLRRAGLDPTERLILCRLVSWTANHDIGHRGFDPAGSALAVRTLSHHGRVLISSEVPLPPELEPYRFHLPPEDLHHVMASASLYLGESATMATESAVLGVPAIHVSTRTLWYSQQLEQHQLLHNIADGAQALAKAEEILRDQTALQETRHRRDCYLEQADNLVSVILGAIEEVAAAKTSPLRTSAPAARNSILPADQGLSKTS